MKLYKKGKKKKKPKGLHILAGLAQEIVTSPTFIVGCPSAIYKKTLPQDIFTNALIYTVLP